MEYKPFTVKRQLYYKEGGGPMLDMGPYYLTSLVSLLGPITRTSCFASIGNKTKKIYSKPLRGKNIDVESLLSQD